MEPNTLANNKPTIYKNGMMFTIAGGCMLRTNFVSQQNKLQPYSKRPSGIKVYSSADECTIRSLEAQIN